MGYPSLSHQRASVLRFKSLFTQGQGQAASVGHTDAGDLGVTITGQRVLHLWWDSFPMNGEIW